MQAVRKTSSSLLNSLFLLTVCMLGYVGAIGFGTVWLRHRISVTANANKALEVQIVDRQRRVGELSAEISHAQLPEQLIRQNEALSLHLVRPREEQVITTGEDVERQLAAKRFGRLFSANGLGAASSGEQ